MQLESGVSGSPFRVRRAAPWCFFALLLGGCVSKPARDSSAAPAPAAFSGRRESERARPRLLPEGADGAQDAKQDGGAPQQTPPAPTSPDERPSSAQEPQQAVEPSEVPYGPMLPDESATGSGGDGWLHGSLSMRYRARSTGDDSDHDLGGVLALDVANPSVPWITGHLQARVDADLDGDDGVFQELSDTYDGSVVGKLYLAYADIELDARPEDSPGMLRVGRQSDPRLPEVLRLDGLTYLTRPMGKNEIELGAYAGIPVHLYESSSDGDRSYGTFAEGRPWRGGRARFDWMHLEDDEVLGDHRDDLLSLGLWQRLAQHWRVEGEYSHLEGDPRDLRLRAFYERPDSATIVRLGYFELLETQTAHATELDPFSEQLFDYFPYRQSTLNVSQAFGERTVVDAGFDLRRVSDSGDVGEFNRDWERYYVTTTLNDLYAEDIALSLTADRWDDDDRDTSSFGADLSYAADARWNGAIGTYYSLYKYEFLELDEREDVRTYYARASYELSARLDLELLYEFEDDDLDTYNTLRLGAQWQF